MNRRAPASDIAFEALLDAAVDAIIIIDHRGTIERVNRATLQLFGYDEEELLGRNVKVLMPEPHRSRHDGYLENYLGGGEAGIIGRGREETAVRKNGEVFPILLTVSEVLQPGRRHFVGFVRDLSETRAAEEQVRRLESRLLRADRLVTLGELTAGIAHEINQPLTAIAAYADAGRSLSGGSDDALRRELVTIFERIGGQSRRAAEVVRRLRRMVRGGTVQKARHDINQIIRNVLLLFEHELNNLDIEIDFDPIEPACELYVDDVQIQQVLVNLVKNSLDALIDADSDNGRIRIRLQRAGSEFLISVSDNGPGIDKELRQRLFEAFFTTKRKGVGLGLSICKSIATAHGGTLHYSRPREGGSRFTLSLPLEAIG
jgi:two-component system sensor kinase FixL